MFFRKIGKKVKPAISHHFFKFEKLHLSLILVQAPNIIFHYIPEQ